jgi:hypothetical protein
MAWSAAPPAVLDGGRGSQTRYDRYRTAAPALTMPSP